MTKKTASRWAGLAASLTLFVLVAAPQVADGQGENQAPAAPAGGAQPQGRGGRGSGGVALGPPTTQTRYDDYTGFTKIFDGQTFTNWNGERDVWSIVEGMLHADTTKTPGQHHIHYSGPGAVMRDFTLKVEVKLSATGANGGIQYRSRQLHPAHGGSIADPLDKPLAASITTMAEAARGQRTDLAPERLPQGAGQAAGLSAVAGPPLPSGVGRRPTLPPACTAVDIPPENVVASHGRPVVPARSATVTAVSKPPIASRSGKVVLATRQQQADAATNVRGLSGRR